MEVIEEISVGPSGFVRVMDHMGSDLTTVNAARISMDKYHAGMTEKDPGFIKFLAAQGHTSPMRHSFLTFHVRAPIFVFRQWMKHRIASDFNEISGRYVEFNRWDAWAPQEWREQSPSIKQGSAGPHPHPERLDAPYIECLEKIFETYDLLLRLGACKEQARTILPLGLYSEVYWTASLQAVAHFISLRRDSHAQAEIREFADAVETLTRQYWPCSLAALLGEDVPSLGEISGISDRDPGSGGSLPHHQVDTP